MTLNARVAALRSAAARLSWPGVIGSGLLLLAAVLYGLTVVPLEIEVERLRTEVANVNNRTSAALPAGASKENTAEQLAKFYAFFPQRDSSPEWLGKIFATANVHGIVLRSGEYKLERQADQKLARYEITLPIVGSYAQIRGFIGAVLAEVPAASVDEIQLRRDSVSGQTLEARVRLSLYLGRA